MALARTCRNPIRIPSPFDLSLAEGEVGMLSWQSHDGVIQQEHPAAWAPGSMAPAPEKVEKAAGMLGKPWDFPMKIMGSPVTFSLKPIHWVCLFQISSDNSDFPMVFGIAEVIQLSCKCQKYWFNNYIVDVDLIYLLFIIFDQFRTIILCAISKNREYN